MIWNWFNKKRVYPQFWELYLECFKLSKQKSSPESYVVFDTETTGLEHSKDVMLSIGAIKVNQNSIHVNQTFELYIKQDVFRASSVPIHGILKEGSLEKVVEAEAVIRFTNFIKDAVLVGHHVEFDINMVNQALKRLGAGKLKNEKMDTDAMYRKLKGWQEDQHTSLDELCTVFKIPMNDRHTALGDAYITAIAFLKLNHRIQASFR